MPDEFLLTYASFDDALTPFAETQVGSERSRVPLFGEELSFEFDLSERHCTGWVDLKEHKAHPCPDSATVDKKYENCSKCRELTGFNPAFYHATQVSEQQEHINQQPHFVYLAYFSPDVIKVGISQEARGLRRIVEQGARMALKLDTFSSANVARQYEARLAGLDGVKEHVSFDAKLKLLEQEFNPDEAARRLQAFRERAEKVLNVSFEGAELVKSENYFYHQPVSLAKLHNMTGTPGVAGKVVAVIGGCLVTEYGDATLAYNLKKYLGYPAKKRSDIDIALPDEQLTLF